MKQIKLEKGITLIALIITIVVLLILAVVTIGAVQESKIIAHAKNAATGYNDEKAKEESAIAGYESLIESKLPGENKDENDENLEETPIPDYSGYEVGDRVYYNSNPDEDNEPEQWIVYTKDDNGIEIISVKGMGNLSLGYNDPYLPTTVPDYDGDGVAENDNDDKALWSYNNAVETINRYCNDIVTATDNSGVRSVGATPEEDVSGMLSQSDFELLLPNRAGDECDIRAEDTYYNEDLEKMKNLNGENITYTDSSLYWYWFASRNKSMDSMKANVGVNHMDNSFSTRGRTALFIGDQGMLESKTVRPIITNPINISLVAE